MVLLPIPVLFPPTARICSLLSFFNFLNGINFPDQPRFLRFVLLGGFPTTPFFTARVGGCFGRCFGRPPPVFFFGSPDPAVALRRVRNATPFVLLAFNSLASRDKRKQNSAHRTL